MGNSKRSKGSITFRLKNSSKSEKPIRLDCSYGRRNRFRYAIGYSVEEEFWNKDKEQVKSVNAVRNSGKINRLINDLRAELNDFMDECITKYIPLDNEMMREHLDAYRNRDKIEKPVEEENLKLLGFIKKFIIQKEKELPKQRNGNKNSTVKSYEQTLVHLSGFESSFEYELGFDIDNEFYSDFIEYMNQKTYIRNEKENHYSLNTIGKQIKNLRVFMLAGLEQEYHTSIKYKKFKILVEITTAIYLELSELKKLFDLDLSDKPHYQLARDIFLIGCEIGQRIGDYHNLSEQTILIYQNEKYIQINQEKTNRPVLCKITPVIEKIMNVRYDGKLPPYIAEQKLNDYIKIAGKKAGIDSEIKHEITRGGKRVVEYIPKYELIMGHTARRTFCTLKYKSDMSVHSIMELSGHTTEKEFMKYIRNPKEERVSQITSSEAFMNSSLSI